MDRTGTITPGLFREAVPQAVPVVFGYLPIAFAFGILARSSGMSGLNAVLMSLLVYAGSAQLIAVGLFAAGVSPFSIIATTLIVNLRHLLMSAALAPYLHRWKSPELAAFAFELTDETFGLHSTRFAHGHTGQPATLLINIIAQVAWVFGTLLGVAAGEIVRDVRPFGLDYALAAMFIALLVFQVKDRILLAAALLGGAISTVLLLAGVSQWNVIIATLVGCHRWNGSGTVDQKVIFLTIVGMALVTFLPRLLPVWLLSSRRLPAPVITWLRYIPASVLAAMLLPSLLVQEGKVHIAPDNLFLLAALPTLLVAWKTRSLFAAVITGMVVVAVARLLGM